MSRYAVYYTSLPLHSVTMSETDAPLAPAFDAPPAHQLLVESELYMQAHPELSQLLTDFTAAALQARPDDVSLFAANYFAPQQAAGSGAAGQSLSARPTHRPQQSSLGAVNAAVNP